MFVITKNNLYWTGGFKLPLKNIPKRRKWELSLTSDFEKAKQYEDSFLDTLVKTVKLEYGINLLDSEYTFHVITKKNTSKAPGYKANCSNAEKLSENFHFSDEFMKWATDKGVDLWNASYADYRNFLRDHRNEPETFSYPKCNFKFFLNGGQIYPPEMSQDYETRKANYKPISGFETANGLYPIPNDRDEGNFHKTVSQICIEADEHQSDKLYLIQLFSYVHDHVTNYKPFEYDFIKEHIQNYLDKIDAKEKIKYFEE